MNLWWRRRKAFTSLGHHYRTDVFAEVSLFWSSMRSIDFSKGPAQWWIGYVSVTLQSRNMHKKQ